MIKMKEVEKSYEIRYCWLAKCRQERLFKEMITTKGKNGTGLVLYMSYSNIKSHFGGDITYKTEDGKGTTFNILIPINK